jgi:enamine deaminase RidA (YjgF/YER057c/UK114 family)
MCAISLAGCRIEARTDRNGEGPAQSSSEFLKPWGDSLSPAGVKSGDLVWIWAMAGTVPGAVPARIVEGGVAAETRQSLENVLDVVEVAGGTLGDVAQCSVFLADGADLAVVREVYAQFFRSPPTRAAVVADGLAQGARVQIECTAVLTTGS